MGVLHGDGDCLVRACRVDQLNVFNSITHRARASTDSVSVCVRDTPVNLFTFDQLGDRLRGLLNYAISILHVHDSLSRACLGGSIVGSLVCI